MAAPAARGRHRARPDAGRHRAPRPPRALRRAATVVGAVAVTAGAATGIALAVAPASTVPAADAEPTPSFTPTASSDTPTSAPPAAPPARVNELSRSSARTPTRPAPSTPPQQKARPKPKPVEPDWLLSCPDADLDDLPNGTYDTADLCELPDDGHLLTTTAARAWWQVARRYENVFDEPVCITDSYRSYGDQEALRAAKPGLAAVPGTSNHGFARALDLCDGADAYGTEQYEWLFDNALRWGWVNPSWAQAGGSKPEAWHWEYVGADLDG